MSEITLWPSPVGSGYQRVCYYLLKYLQTGGNVFSTGLSRNPFLLVGLEKTGAKLYRPFVFGRCFIRVIYFLDSDRLEGWIDDQIFFTDLISL